MEEGIQVVETQGYELLEAQQRAEYDIQIATAKKYPRSLKRVKDTCIEIVTMDDTGEIAASCSYAISRAGKTISGPSTHLAQIIAQQFGNLRVDSKIKQILYKEKQIVAEAICFDLETNYGRKVEVRKTIQDKNGHIYSNDMITVTGNAANSIAFRNAVFQVVPRAIVEAVLKAARDKVTDNIKTDADMVKLRKDILDSFLRNYKVTEQMLLKYIGLERIEQITKDHVPDLRAMFQSLKDGDSTVDEMFNLTARTSANASEIDKVNKTFVKTPGGQAIKPATTPVVKKPDDQFTTPAAGPVDTKIDKKPDPVKKDDKKKDPPPTSTAAPRLF